MSWYAVGGVACTVRATTQQEPWSIDACWRSSLYGVSATARDSAQSKPWGLGDDWPWWRWDPGGSINVRCNERSVWDPDIKEYVPDP